ncbi:hypothetical protein [Salirhabdus sp. Marseille-P4669]|uniref:hypothetical protein n=1 Tax=Salirhabdus sp. Marseille-P4669 TaxID=2042310 RepID=UPI000C7D5A17|nr:hypothetical protein [Salirhabdus sp. Marseille-P4669]
MKRVGLLLILSFIFGILFLSGCADDNKENATIVKNPDSPYMETFKELGIGTLYDFSFTLPNANKRWVTLWVEKYVNGEKDPNPLAQLSYGHSPNELEEGSLGWGIINPRTEDTQVFLYSPSTTLQPRNIDLGYKELLPSGSEYTIGEDKVELSLGESYTLAVFRQPSTNSVKLYDYTNKSEVEKMIKEDSLVLLLKIKIEEK